MYLRPNFAGEDADGAPIVDRETHPDIDLTTTETYPFYRPEPPIVYGKLPNLRSSALYLFGSTSDLSRPEARQQKLDITGIGVGGSGGVEEDRVKAVVIEDAGHLVPFTHPNDCAGAAAAFVADEVKRWRLNEETWRRQWEIRRKTEKTMLTDGWRRNLGGDPRAKPNEKL